MEESKLQALADSLSKHSGKKGLGTYGGEYSWSKTANSSRTPSARNDGLPTNPLYSNFVKEGAYDPSKKTPLSHGDGRAIKRDFSDIPAIVDETSSDETSKKKSSKKSKEERKAEKKAIKKAAKKAAKLEAKKKVKLEEKRKAKLEEKRRLKKLAKTVCIGNPLQTFAIPTRLTFVNGIGYNEKHIEADAEKISSMFGTTVSYCFNPSAMTDDDDLVGYLNDLKQAGTQKLGRITMEVDALVKHLKDMLALVGKKGRVIHIAHSQGALITSLAVKQLSPIEMNRMEVLCFGGAAALRQTSQTPFYRCINYYAVNDPLLWVVPVAEQRLRSGLVGDDEFCFLTPKLGDPIEDHYLLNPTYAQALYWEGQRYQKMYRSMVYRALTWLGRFIATLVQLILKNFSTLVSSCGRIFAGIAPPRVKKDVVMETVNPGGSQF